MAAAGQPISVKEENWVVFGIANIVEGEEMGLTDSHKLRIFEHSPRAGMALTELEFTEQRSWPDNSQRL